MVDCYNLAENEEALLAAGYVKAKSKHNFENRKGIEVVWIRTAVIEVSREISAQNSTQIRK